MRYPVICLQPNNTMIYGFKDQRSLKIADRGLTKKGVFNDVTIIDSEGLSYLVKEVKILGWATPFWGYSLKRPGRLVNIEFELEEKEKISLEKLKNELLQRVKENDYFKETFTVKEIEDHISSSTTFNQLLSFFI